MTPPCESITYSANSEERIMELKSFHGDPKIKEFYLTRIRQHAANDEIIHGTYWEQGRGCAIGCVIHSADHTAYEDELGIPEWLARLEDQLFEGQSNGDAKQFAVAFLEAIPVGVNLAPLKWQFCAFLLKENIECVVTLAIFDDLKTHVVSAIRQVLACHETALQTGTWDESAAKSAAESAWSAAESAAWSARSAAWSAAWSAAYKRYADHLLTLLREAT